MKKLTSIVIGCGKGGEGSAGAHSIGYAHANAYRASAHFELVGGCDLHSENLARFAAHYGLAHAHADLGALLAATRPDCVSICTYAGSHRAIFEQCVAAGVKAFWCEKPFVLNMDDGRAMLALAERAGVKIVVNHYRPYLHLFSEMKRLLAGGAIGTPVLFSSSLGDWDQMEWGTHWLDMMRFLADDQPVNWVMGQARCASGKRGYGHAMEDHTVNYFRFADGTRGLLDGGASFRGDSAVLVQGTEGILNARWTGKLVLTNRDGHREIPVHSDVHNPHPDQPSAHGRLLADFHAWLSGTGPEPRLSGRGALATSELYLACYESALIGDRVDLPLGAQSSFPLEAVALRQKKTAAPAS